MACGKHFVHLVACSMENVSVAFKSIQAPAASGKSCECLLEDSTEVETVTVAGQPLDGDDLRLACQAFAGLGKKVLYAVTQRMCASALHAQSHLEPTVDLVRQSLHQIFAYNPSSVAAAITGITPNAMKKDSSSACQPVIRLIKNAITASFEKWVSESMKDLAARGWHPAKHLIQNPGTDAADSMLQHVVNVERTLLASQVEKLKPFIREILFSPCLVQQYVEFVKAVVHFNRSDVTLNDHRPFPRSKTVGVGSETQAFETFQEALKKQMQMDGKPPGNGARLDLLLQAVKERHGLRVNTKSRFNTLRQAIAHLLRYGASPDDRVDVDKVVMTMFKTGAYALNQGLAHIVDGGTHPALFYVPCKEGQILDAHACIRRKVLRSREDLGVPEDLYRNLEAAGNDKKRLRQAIENYSSTGQHLLNCLTRFELPMTSVVLGHDIAFFILDDDEGTPNIVEYIFHPRLSIKVPMEVKETLRAEFQTMGEETDFVSFAAAADGGERPVEVVCALDGEFYVLSGDYIFEDEHSTWCSFLQYGTQLLAPSGPGPTAPSSAAAAAANATESMDTAQYSACPMARDLEAFEAGLQNIAPEIFDPMDLDHNSLREVAEKMFDDE